MSLLLKFYTHLENRDFYPVPRHHGALFHRWLPQGEKHAVILDTGKPDTELRVWFERFGFIDGDGWIRFDSQRRDIDPEIIPKQAILEAGPLLGLLKVEKLPDDQLIAVRDNKTGTPHYIRLGKRVVKLIYPPVVRFLDILRTHFGQYWIRTPPKWDSRHESLGSYCRTRFQLRWSLDEGKSWKPFVPDHLRVSATLRTSRSFKDYLTQEDWEEIGKLVGNGFEPSPAAFALSRTHQFLDQGNLKYALVEGVSALEIALHEFIREKLNDADSLLGQMSAFWQLSLRTQVTTLAAVVGKAELQDIESTIEAVDIRNKLVHEGISPPDKTAVKLRKLMKTVATLLQGPRFRFVTATPGNALMSAEKWEERKKE